MFTSVKLIHLFDFSSERFHEGIVVTSSYMAIGLVFDQVTVPFSDAGNYKTCEEKATSEIDGILSRGKAFDKITWIEEALVNSMPMNDDHRKAV